jgi:MFS family permease
MMAARFFLGLFEAGYGPGIPFLLSFFYLRHEIGLRIGIFLSAAPLATCFAGALAYGITFRNLPTIANWRLLFLVEGLPCIIMGAVAWRFLPDNPEKARFLTPEEKVIAKARGVRQVGADETYRVGHIQWADIPAAFLDLKVRYHSFSLSPFSVPICPPYHITNQAKLN